MNQNQFREMMSYVGMGGNQLLIERLFYVLEHNDHNKVDYWELMIGLVLFKTDSIEYKIRFIFSINHDPYLNYE